MANARNHNVGAVYQRGLVHCARCGSAIYLQRLQGLADEFSVRCANCGHRGIYSRRAIVIVEFPERRSKSRPR